MIFCYLMNLSLIVILLTLLASAIVNPSQNEISRWCFDDNFLDSQGNNNLLAGSGVPVFYDVVINGTNHTALNFEAANSEFLQNTTTQFLGGVNGFSFDFWVNVSTFAFGAMFDIEVSPRTYVATQTTGIIFVVGGSGAATVPVAQLQTNKWYHITAMSNGTDHYVYVNGLLNQSSTPDKSVPSATQFFVGRVGSSFFDGMIESARFFNQTLSPAQISLLHGNGTADCRQFTVISNNAPLFDSYGVNSFPDGNITRESVLINWSFTDLENDPLTYTLYLDRNATPQTVYWTGTDSNVTINVTSEGEYNYFVRAHDGNGTGDSSQRSFILDLAFPYMNITSPANLTYWSYLFDNISFAASAKDDNIFLLTSGFYNSTHTFQGVSNDTVSNEFNDTLLLSAVYNITGFADGTYFIDVNASDSHTDNELPESLYEFSDSSVIRFSDNVGNFLTLEAGIFAPSFKLLDFEDVGRLETNNYVSREKDRYIFGISALADRSDFEMGWRFLKKDLVLVDTETSHFVWAGRYWIDFVVDAPFASELSSDRDYYYVKITGYSDGDRSNVTTRSIGGLNVVEKTLTVFLDATSPQADNVTVASVPFGSNFSFGATLHDANTVDTVIFLENSTGQFVQYSMQKISDNFFSSNETVYNPNFRGVSVCGRWIVNDSAGNTLNHTACGDVEDYVPSIVWVSYPPLNGNVNGSDPITFTYQLNDFDNDTTQCNLLRNGSSVNNVTSVLNETGNVTYDVSAHEEASYAWALQCNNTFGMLTTVNKTVGADQLSPRMNLFSPENSSIGGQHLTVIANASDLQISSCILEADGINVSGSYAASLCTGSVSLSKGDHVVRFFANDSLGRWNVTQSFGYTVAQSMSCIYNSNPIFRNKVKILCEII